MFYHFIWGLVNQSQPSSGKKKNRYWGRLYFHLIKQSSILLDNLYKPNVPVKRLLRANVKAQLDYHTYDLPYHSE